MQKQQTLAKPISLKGIGLHSGCEVNLTLNPAPENYGIVFKRVDLPNQPEFPAIYSGIVDTRNCSCLGDKAGNLVSTIEHLMASLAVKGIDNALIEVDHQELPIMDGSAKQFFDVLTFAFSKALSEIELTPSGINTTDAIPSYFSKTVGSSSL